MAETRDYKPKELSLLVREGKRRTLGSDDIDASGKGFWRHKQFIINQLLQENILKGITRFPAQILKVEKSNIPDGAGGAVLANLTSQRVFASYRIRVPVIHQIIPNPCLEPDKKKAMMYLKMHPVAIYEAQGYINSENTPKEGSLVWVSFQAGPGANRFKGPVIESVIKHMADNTWNCEFPGSTAVSYSSVTTAGTTAGAATSSTPVVPLSTAEIEGLTNNSLDTPGLTECQRAKILYAKLHEQFAHLASDPHNLTEDQRNAMVMGMMANAYAESGFQPSIGSTVDITGTNISHLLGLTNANDVVSDSWGLWQNNITGATYGGGSMLYYYHLNSGGFPNFPAYEAGNQTEFYNALGDYIVESEQNKENVAAALTDEDWQISYAVSVATDQQNYSPSLVDVVQNGYTSPATTRTNKVTGETYTIPSETFTDAAAAAAAWWQVEYEKSVHSPGHRASYVSKVQNILNKDCEIPSASS